MIGIARISKSRSWIIGIVSVALAIGLLIYFWGVRISGRERVPIENERPIQSTAAPMANWDNLIPQAVVESDLSQAESDLGFVVVEPSAKLGTPAQITATDSQLVPTDGQELGIQYKGDQYGLYWVLELPTETTQEQLEALVALCDPTKGCEGKWSIVSLQNGIQAVLVIDPSVTTISWLQAGIRIEVTGPAETLTGDDAVAIANEF
jgi:hypothetical protein